MNIEISGRNYEINDRIRELVNTKLEKIRKYFTDIIEVRCVLNVEKYRNICEISVNGKEHDLKASQEADTMEDAVTATIDHLKRQAQKNRKKITDHHRKAKNTGPDAWQVSVLEPAQLRQKSNNAPRIIQTSDLPIRPMSIEQAALELDGSKNEFIVFRDLDTERVTVIYKRRDNNFGMIAPEF
jgi:putative sigma-54 modulation protein